MLAATEGDLARLAKITELAELDAVAVEDREEFLTAAFLTQDASWWEDALHSADVGAARCVDMGWLRDTYCREADGETGVANGGSYSFSRFEHHPSGHTVIQLDPIAVRPSRASIVAPVPSEKYGNSTTKILAALQYSDADVTRMVQAGEVSLSWSSEYLPS